MITFRTSTLNVGRSTFDVSGLPLDPECRPRHHRRDPREATGSSTATDHHPVHSVSGRSDSGKHRLPACRQLGSLPSCCATRQDQKVRSANVHPKPAVRRASSPCSRTAAHEAVEARATLRPPFVEGKASRSARSFTRIERFAMPLNAVRWRLVKTERDPASLQSMSLRFESMRSARGAQDWEPCEESRDERKRVAAARGSPIDAAVNEFDSRMVLRQLRSVHFNWS